MSCRAGRYSPKFCLNTRHSARYRSSMSPPEFYDFKLDDPNLVTALIVYVETAPDTGAGCRVSTTVEGVETVWPCSAVYPCTGFERS